MLKLSAFADEIGPSIDEQIEHCSKNDVTHIELRGVNGLNILDFPKDLQQEIKTKLADKGMGVVSIGSPIGKEKIDHPWEQHFDRFKTAVELADFFEAPFIRIFSYYPAEGQSFEDFVSEHRDEVVRRMRQKAEFLTDRDVVLVHENEKDIFGDTGERCRDILSAVDHPKLRAAFDFANFVQVGENPMDNWPKLKPFTDHIHIKDALSENGKVVPAGKGDGHIAEILRDAYENGYRGFLSLEPHLKVAGHSHGETGPELFKTAVDSLKKVCADQGIPLYGVA